MKLTKEQRKAVRCDKSVLLESCPGSGKTRTIIAKLIRCIEEIRGSPRRVACITYTNPAVQEIESRLRTFGSPGDEEYCEVSTIHSFCLTNILGRFYWHIPRFKKGFRIANPESEDYVRIATATLDRHGIDRDALESLALANREPDGAAIVSGALTAAAAQAFWNALERDGFIDFCNIVYWSYVLLAEHPSIAHSLACRFSWILVDEFQDTSALQVEILKLIGGERRTRFFLVGDPYQSIYGFAGARPSLMYEFGEFIKAKRDFHLTGNFRSSSRIIEHAQRLLPRVPPMEAVGDAAGERVVPTHVHATTLLEAIVGSFLPQVDQCNIPYGECAILAPSWFSIYPLGRQLRELGVPVFGVGARPYKRTHLFAALAEHICSYLHHRSPEQIPRIERELFMLLQRATGAPNYRVFSYSGRRVVYRLIRMGDQLRRQHRDAIGWLVASAAEFTAIFQKEDLISKSLSSLLPDSVTDMRDDMVRRRVDTANLSLDDLGIFADPSKNVKLLTIHAAKGREFQAVAIVDLHEGKLPHWSAVDMPQLEESKRVFYVAITRARQVLMYVTDDGSWRNRPSRFLGEVLNDP
jgi:DNA helicase-2/ATP-dependent DNA helicase PcrA